MRKVFSRSRISEKSRRIEEKRGGGNNQELGGLFSVTSTELNSYNLSSYEMKQV